MRALALLSTGLLAGALGYGAVNLVPTFNAVPLDVRLTFHTALMRMNGPVVQTVMACAAVSTATYAVLSRRWARLLAAGSGGFVLVAFLVTRFGNVPINARMKAWAVTSAPPDHAAVLRRWETFNDIRTAAAVTAFVLMLVAVDRGYAARSEAGSGSWNG
jgi:uncharacterized membrane protein